MPNHVHRLLQFHLDCSKLYFIRKVVKDVNQSILGYFFGYVTISYFLVASYIENFIWNILIRLISSCVFVQIDILCIRGMFVKCGNIKVDTKVCEPVKKRRTKINSQN